MPAHHWNRNNPGYTAPLKICGIIVSNTQLIIAVINRYTYYTILLIYVHKLTAQSGEASAIKDQILEDLVVSTDLATNRLMIYGLSCWLNQAARQLVTLHLGFSVPQQRDCVEPHTHMHSVHMFACLQTIKKGLQSSFVETGALCCGFISV